MGDRNCVEPVPYPSLYLPFFSQIIPNPPDRRGHLNSPVKNRRRSFRFSFGHTDPGKVLSGPGCGGEDLCFWGQLGYDSNEREQGCEESPFQEGDG